METIKLIRNSGPEKGVNISKHLEHKICILNIESIVSKPSVVHLFYSSVWDPMGDGV